MTHEETELSKAQEAVRLCGPLLYPTGEARAALCHAAVVLDRYYLAAARDALAWKRSAEMLEQKLKQVEEELAATPQKKWDEATLREIGVQRFRAERAETELSTVKDLILAHDRHWAAVADAIGSGGGYGGVDSPAAYPLGTAASVVRQVDRMRAERDEWERRAEEYCQDAATREMDQYAKSNEIATLAKERDEALAEVATQDKKIAAAIAEWKRLRAELSAMRERESLWSNQKEYVMKSNSTNYDRAEAAEAKLAQAMLIIEKAHAWVLNPVAGNQSHFETEDALRNFRDQEAK